MNILKRIGSIALVAALMMGAATMPASAQFKGLGNKLKGKVEKTVKEKAGIRTKTERFERQKCPAVFNPAWKPQFSG